MSPSFKLIQQIIFLGYDYVTFVQNNSTVGYFLDTTMSPSLKIIQLLDFFWVRPCHLRSKSFNSWIFLGYDNVTFIQNHSIVGYFLEKTMSPSFKLIQQIIFLGYDHVNFVRINPTNNFFWVRPYHFSSK